MPADKPFALFATRGRPENKPDFRPRKADVIMLNGTKWQADLVANNRIALSRKPIKDAHGMVLAIASVQNINNSEEFCHARTLIRRKIITPLTVLPMVKINTAFGCVSRWHKQ